MPFNDRLLVVFRSSLSSDKSFWIRAWQPSGSSIQLLTIHGAACCVFGRSFLIYETCFMFIGEDGISPFCCCIEINKQVLLVILNETSKPPLNIFSNILTYMIHKWLQFTLNMKKSIKLVLSNFHFHKLKLTCSIDRLYTGSIAFNFRTNA